MYKEKEIVSVVKNLPVNRMIKTEMYKFIKVYNFTDKKIDLLLKFKNPTEQLGFLYRHILTAAYQFGVPLVYIEEYKRYKKYLKTYKNSNYYNNAKYEELKHSVNLKSKMLISATIEITQKKNTRQEKINEILIKMSNKKNNI